MSELRQIAQSRLIEIAGESMARLHVRAGGDAADRQSIEKIASWVWKAGLSGQVCVPLDELPVDNPRRILARSPLVAEPHGGETPEDVYPLVIQSDHLYSLRHWRAEQSIATGLLALAEKTCAPSDPSEPEVSIDSRHAISRDSLQLAALDCAVKRQLLVLSGGPGTGKTTTLGVIVRELTKRDGNLRVALSAPTGKATARLNEAIGAQQGVAIASTLHRLLGYQAGGVFTFGPDNPLPYDVVVVDECSMVDAMLGARLFCALPSHAKLILAGDKDQLSSVEPGAFFGSVCAAKATVLTDSIVILKKNYRQLDAPEIAEWASAVRDGELSSPMPSATRQVRRIALSDTDGFDLLVQTALTTYLPLIARAATATDEAAQFSLLKAFEQLRVLTAMRVGPYGVEAVNQKLISGFKRNLELPASQWFAGRLVIVSINAPALNLFNGDIGLTTTDSAGQLSVLFNINERAHRLLPLQMPAHEDAFALTVHQAQGSDFAQVLLLPAPAEHPLATRAGLYTGITRARERLHIFAHDQDLIWAANRPTVQHGALTERIESLAALAPDH